MQPQSKTSRKRFVLRKVLQPNNFQSYKNHRENTAVVDHGLYIDEQIISQIFTNFSIQSITSKCSTSTEPYIVKFCTLQDKSTGAFT